MKDKQADKATGAVYQVAWYLMLTALAGIIVFQQFGIAEHTSSVVTLLSHVYLALIPAALLALAVVLFTTKARMVATISALLFVSWVILRFFVS